MKKIKKISWLLTLLLLLQWSVFPFITSLLGLYIYAQENPDHIKINFQPDLAEVPMGYIPDYGETYGTCNSYTYGWNMDHSDLTVVRETYQEPQLDTFIQFHQDGIWEIELENGSYDVTVSVGDEVYGSTNTINIESINYWNQHVLAEGEFLQETKTIEVNDGKLTLDHGELGEGETTLNFIEIRKNSDLIPPIESGDGVGLKAEYYNGINFDELKFTRLDEIINFDWGGGTPDESLDRDAFSIRWTGKVEPKFSEPYIFYTETHGGVRLWVNHQLLIDDWNSSNMVNQSGEIALIAGELYDISMEYREDQGAAQARLLWSSDGQVKEIIPTAQLYPPFIPDVPTNINVITTSTTVTLNWEQVSGATGYEVEADGVTIDNGSNTTYVHSNLMPGTQHHYRVRSKVPEIAGAWSGYLTAETNIATPANINVTESDSSITITWDEIPGALAYEIEVDGQLIDNGTDTIYIHNQLMPNTEHTYRVRAKNDTGVSDWSPLITKTVLSDIPTNIMTIATSTSITLSWDGVADAIGYEVEADGEVINNGLSTSFVHNGLTPNTQHTYRIRALKTDGASDWTTLIIKSTLPESGNGIGLKGEYFESDNLTNLKTTRIDQTIDFNWANHPPAEGIEDDVFTIRWTGQVEPRFSENYTFYSAAHGGIRLWVNNQLLVDDWEAHYFSENNRTLYLEAGKRYDIKMEYREVNGAAQVFLYWESASQTKEIIPQSQLYPIGIPQNIVTSSTETSITVNWDAVTCAENYEIEVDGVVINNGSSTSYTHTNLTPGTVHSYRVRAINGIVTGEWSSSVTEATLLANTSITAMDATDTTITVSWEAVNGATKYDIEVDGTIINVGNHTSFVHEGLLSGTEHTYRVRPRSQAVIGEWTSLSNKWTLPGIPENINSTATSTSVSLEWDDVRGATGYEIEVYNTIVDNGNSTKFTEEGLNPNTQRTYRIRATNVSGIGEWSSIVAIIMLPETPKNIATTATDTSIAVTWDAVAGATAYDLEVDGQVILNILTTSYSHTGLSPNTTHTYKVRAKNDRGASDWSQTIEATTLPQVPENLLAMAASTEIIVTWNEVSGATGYDIEVDGVVFDNGTSRTYIHTGLELNSEHTYRVRARNGELMSFWSEKVTAITLIGIPTNLQGTSTSTEVTLTWDSVIGAIDYDVEVDGVIVDNGLSTTYYHNGLSPNSEHTYRVRARGIGGAGEWSEYISISTVFGVPKNLRATATSSSITLTWDEVTGATGYDVLVDGEIIDNGDSTIFEHKGLEPYSWHVYRVRAKTIGVLGEWSEPITQVTLLGTPTNIDVEATSTKITLTWDDVQGATSYEIEVDGSLIEHSADTTFEHVNLLPNTEHTYRIRAKNDIVYSDWSILISQMTAPGIPTNLTASATTHSITLTWDAVDGATDYDLEIDGQIVSNILDTTYVHEGLEPNTMHFYRVRARNEGEVSEWTELIEPITTPEITVNVGQDNMFNLVVVAPKKEGVHTRTIVVTYNPDELEVLDLSGNTPEVNLTTGLIDGTNMTVVEFSSGKIVYTVENADKTIVNSIQFMAKTNDYSKITYTVE